MACSFKRYESAELIDLFLEFVFTVLVVHDASLYQDEPHRQQPPEDAGARGPFPELPHEVRHFGGVQTLCNGTRQPEFSQKMALK